MMLSLLLAGVAYAQCGGFSQGTPEWWACMYPWQVTAPSGGATSWCDVAANSPGTFPTNEECNNAGTCKIHSSWQQQVYNSGAFTWGKCECADTTQENNFVYSDPRWVYQTFTGDQCTKFQFQLYGTITYLIRIATWDPSSATRQGIANVFECNRGSGGNGVIFDPADPADALTIP